MAVSLSELLTPLTADDVVTIQIDMLSLAGFPATSWQSGSVPLTLIQADAETLSDMSNTVATVAAGGFVSTADADWQPLIATSHYDLTPKTAVVNQGYVTLSDPAGAGPFTITALQLYVGPHTGTLRFQNLTGGTLPQNGTLILPVQAEAAGSAYNLANLAIDTMLTPLPGVVVTNVDPGDPVTYPGSGQGTWISRQGTDPESLVSVAARCTQKWALLGTGSNTAAYEYNSVTSTPTVTRVNVVESPGQVFVYCAGASGPSSGADVTSVDAVLQAKRPLGVKVTTSAATTRAITLGAAVQVHSANSLTAQAAFAAALTEYAASLPLGGIVYIAELVRLFMDITGVINVSVYAPVTDVVLSANEVAVFTVVTTWTTS